MDFLILPYFVSIWGCSSVGRASQWHCEGRRFESDQLHHFLNSFQAEVVEWQTRMIQVHVPQGVGVQVPLSAPSPIYPL